MCELAGQQHAQLGAHLIAQLGITLGLRRLPLQRIHLARDFVEDVVDARQVQPGVFQARLGQPLAGLELRDASGFFDDGAAVGRLAAQNLPDAPLLDDGVRLRSQAGAHEDVLDIAQAAELAVQQVLALAGAEQAARNHDLARFECALELAAANLEHYVRNGRRLLLRHSAARPLRQFACDLFVGLSGTNFLGVALGLFRAGGAQGGLVPLIRHVVLDIHFGLA